MELFRLFGSIVIDDKDAMKKLGDAQKESRKTAEATKTLSTAGKNVGKAFAAGAAVVGTAAIAITGKMVTVLDDIDKASQRAGVGAEEFQRWSHAAGMSGIEISKMEAAMVKSSRTLAMAAEGNKKAADTYEKLGINIKGLSSEEVFDQTIAKLADMENEVERNALANAIFGKSFADLNPLLNEGSAGVTALKGELDDLGAVMSGDQVKAGAALNDTMDRVGKMFGAIGAQIGAELIPYFDKFGNWILENKDSIVSGITGFVDNVGKIVSWIVENFDKFVPIISGLVAGFATFKILSTVIPIVQALVTVIGAMTAGTLTFNAALLANPIGIIVVAVIALVAAGVALYKNWDVIVEKAKQLFSFIGDGFKAFFGAIVDGFVAFKDKAIEIVTNMITGLVTGITGLGTKAVELFVAMKDKVIAAVTGLKDSAVNLFNNLKDGLANVVTNVVTTITGKFTQAKEKVASIFTSIKDAVMSPFRTATDFVGKQVDKIKGFLNFKWAFPKLKMPHFKISGSANPLKWLSGGVPKLKVDWYAKGGVFTKPTIFGSDGLNLKGAGDAGPEAAIPLTAKVLGGIGKGIAATMNLAGGTSSTDTDQMLFVFKKLLQGMKFEIVDDGRSLRTLVDDRILEVI